MKKIKVLRIIARLNIGGPAIHTVLLTEGLDKERFESVLVCGRVSKDEGDMGYYAQAKGVKPVFIPRLRREIGFFGDVSAFFKLLQVIAKERPDIIHTHTAKAGTLGRCAGLLYNFLGVFLRRKKAALVHTFHGHVFEGYFGRVKSGVFILVEKFLALFSERLITVSASVKKELLRFGIACDGKIEVIPLGFDLDKFLAIEESGREAFNIGIVGRLVPVKNHRLFLDAAHKLASRGFKNLRFKIVGDGELRKELEDYAVALGIGDFVDFRGWQRDLAAVYSGLDIVVLSSLNEGTPVSLIEAMASARAVISSEVGGVADLMGEALGAGGLKDFRLFSRGILFDSGDAEGLAQSLAFFIAHPDKRLESGRRGRAYAREQFSKQRLIRDIEQLYHKLALKQQA